MDTHAPIEELVICRLNTTTDQSGFRKALAATNEWLQTQPGFLWRRSGTTDDGRLVDRCGWSTLAAAETASARFMESAEGREFGTYLEAEGMVFLHYRPFEGA